MDGTIKKAARQGGNQYNTRQEYSLTAQLEQIRITFVIVFTACAVACAVALIGVVEVLQ